MVLDLMGEDHFMTIERMSRVWSHGVYTKYPYQSQLLRITARGDPRVSHGRDCGRP